jgi:hypothetical protein
VEAAFEGQLFGAHHHADARNSIQPCLPEN